MASKLLLPLLLIAGAVAVGVGSASASESEPRGEPAPPGTIPDELLALQQQALTASIDPNQIRAVADQLEAAGFEHEADVLEQKASAIDAMTDEEYIAFVGCTLAPLGATPGSIVELPFKGDPEATVVVTIPTPEECAAYYQRELM